MRWVPLILGLWWLLAACTGSGSSPRTATSPSPTTTAPAVAAGTRPDTTGAATAPARPGQGLAIQEACRLVTTAEVARAAGVPMQEGRFTPGGLGGTCIYEQQRAQATDLADRVYVQPFTGRTVYDELRAQATGAQDVPGLGDRAYASPLEVTVMKGNRGVYITWDHATVTPGVTDAQRQAQLVELARVAIGRW